MEEAILYNYGASDALLRTFCAMSLFEIVLGDMSLAIMVDGWVQL